MSQVKRVLSIDGGGMYGLVPALWLKHLKESLERDDVPRFDMYAGTSTGAILAAALNNGVPVENIIDFYDFYGPKIFGLDMLHKFSTAFGLIGPKYSKKQLRKGLNDVFSTKTLGMTSLFDKLIVTSYDIETRSPVLFRNWMPEYAGYRVQDVVLASASAPTFFRPQKLEPVSTAPRLATRHLIDGGMVANNPAAVAYVEAKKLWGDADIRVLSLGTGTLGQNYKYKNAKRWGLVQWARPVIFSLMDGGQDVTDRILSTELGSDKYLRYHPHLGKYFGGMDDAGEFNRKSIRDLVDKPFTTAYTSSVKSTMDW